MSLGHITKSAIALTAIVLAGASAAAQQSEPASDPVVLTIESNGPGGKIVEMTMKDVEAIGVTKIATTTPWDNGVVVFEGPPMKQLLAKAGIAGNTVTAVALDNYVTDIPVADFDEFPVILATKRDGQYMSVQKKGPLFIMYPFDASPQLKSEKYYARAAWQLRSLTVK